MNVLEGLKQLLAKKKSLNSEDWIYEYKFGDVVEFMDVDGTLKKGIVLRYSSDYLVCGLKIYGDARKNCFGLSSEENYSLNYIVEVKKEMIKSKKSLFVGDDYLLNLFHREYVRSSQEDKFGLVSSKYGKGTSKSIENSLSKDLNTLVTGDLLINRINGSIYYSIVDNDKHKFVLYRLYENPADILDCVSCNGEIYKIDFDDSIILDDNSLPMDYEIFDSASIIEIVTATLSTNSNGKALKKVNK